MAELRTEEEQIQAIKDWWKRNGSSLLIGIAAALAIVFGWQAWQNQQAQQRAEAANQFAELLGAFSNQDDETSAKTVGYVAKKLREDYTDSAYAIYGNLILARQQLMREDNPDAAIDSLSWALEHAKGHPELSLVIQNRLARTQFAAGNYDDALQTISNVKDPGTFASILSELKGDILLAQGNRDGAREAYLSAREQSEQGRNGVLELKLSDLGVGEGA